MKLFQSTIIDLVSNANVVKELVIDKLIREKYLNAEEGQEFLEKFSVIVAEKGILGTAMDKITFNEENKNSLLYKVVKI